MSAADAAIQKKSGAGKTSIEEIEDILKIVKSLEKSRLVIKGIRETTKTIKNEAKEQKGIFLSKSLETSATSISEKQ